MTAQPARAELKDRPAGLVKTKVSTGKDEEQDTRAAEEAKVDRATRRTTVTATTSGTNKTGLEDRPAGLVKTKTSNDQAESRTAKTRTTKIKGNDPEPRTGNEAQTEGTTGGRNPRPPKT